MIIQKLNIRFTKREKAKVVEVICSNSQFQSAQKAQRNFDNVLKVLLASCSYLLEESGVMKILMRQKMGHIAVSGK